MQDYYEFGSFRLDPRKKRLTCGEEPVALTPKEFVLLEFLIENRSRTVGRDEILEIVWKDTFVEEGTLTRNISWLRKKLAAYSDTKIIETVPKRGYRFLPEINATQIEIEIEEKTFQQVQIEEIIEIEDANIPESKINLQENAAAGFPAPRANRIEFSLFLALLGLLIFGALAFAAFSIFVVKPQEIALASKIVPFSGLPGRESAPAFSPDGKEVVFAWDGGIENGSTDIYIKLVGAGEPFRLTDTPEINEINPVFSPDGKYIAFVRLHPTQNEILLKPALGGAETLIYNRASYASLSFSPDGKTLAHAELGLSGEETGIFTIDLETKKKTRLTVPENPAVDHTPRFSPDGKYLAFIRYFSSFRREIFIVPASGGEPRQITADNTRIYSLAWNTDSKSLYFTSFRETNQMNLWKIPANGGAARMISTGSKNLNDLAIAPDGKTLAYVEETADANIWEIESNQTPQLLIRSSFADHSQQFSPDGTRIVFASERTGNYEIWLADADGRNQRQLSESNGSTGSPRFSPDGRQIVFDAQLAGTSNLYVVAIDGGIPSRLTNGSGNNFLPAWSIDGKWIFYLSDRTGENQIWKMPASGGEAVQITKQGAFEMCAAPDGKTIIYSKGTGKSGLWSVGLNGENEKPLPELADAGAWRSWSVTSKGIFYTYLSVQPPFHVMFYDLTTKQTRQIATVEKPPLLYYSNLSVSDNGRKMLYASQDQSASVIMFAALGN